MTTKFQISNFKFQIKRKNPQPTTHNLQPNHGFTLVELLVVIAVIALVMAVLFPNFMGFRQRARDTQRKSDLSQIQKALELYKLDQSPPAYPTTGGLPASLCGQCFSSAANCSGNIYLRKIPCDPGGAALPTPYAYTLGSDVLQYTIVTCLENAADQDRDTTTDTSCTSTTNISYTIKEP